MRSIGCTQPVLGRQHASEFGDRQVDWPQIDTCQETPESADLRLRAVAERLAQYLRQQEHGASTSKVGSALLEERDNATTEWMFGGCCEDEDVGVERVHLAAVAVGPDLADEFLGPLWRQARASRKVLIASGHELLM